MVVTIQSLSPLVITEVVVMTAASATATSDEKLASWLSIFSVYHFTSSIQDHLPALGIGFQTSSRSQVVVNKKIAWWKALHQYISHRNLYVTTIALVPYPVELSGVAGECRLGGNLTRLFIHTEEVGRRVISDDGIADHTEVLLCNGNSILILLVLIVGTVMT